MRFLQFFAIFAIFLIQTGRVWAKIDASEKVEKNRR
jgi:hypothetical protein